MRPTVLTFCAAVVTSLLASAADESPVKLELKYPEGSKFTEQQTMHLHQVLTLAGMDIETDVDQVVTTTQEVGARKSDGTTPILIKIGDLKAHMSLPGGLAVDFDSTEPAREVDPQLKFLSDMFKAIAGAHYTLSISPKGKVESVEGTQSIIDKAGDLDPKAVDALRSRLSPESIKRAWQQNVDRIPEILVRAGEPWTRKEVIDVGSGQNFTFDRKYEYVGVVEKNGKMLDRIQVRTTGVTYAMTGDPNSPVKVDKADLKVKSSDGSFLFDRSEGRVVESSETIRITGTLAITIVANNMTLDADLDLTLEDNSSPKVD